MKLRLALAVALFAVPLGACAQELATGTSTASETAATSLGALVGSLSEEGAYFDTDNLISNERSFVRVLDDLRPAGGVYLGVGPEQNFNFIARRRPEWAFIVDIRRDNMVQHLLLHAILSSSETPEDYLRSLLSLPPRSGDAPGDEGFGALLDRLRSERADEEVMRGNATRFERHIREQGLALTDEDQQHLRAILREFFVQQLDLRFRSHGRGFSRRYPSYQDLIAAKGPSGAWESFLARPHDYAFLRSLSRRGRLVPVVGNFAGPHALRAVGDFVRSRGLEVTTFYTSNVEYYLLGNGSFGRYAENVAALPLATDGLFVRAYFDYGMQHPHRLPGHRSATVLQTFGDFLRLEREGEIRSYWDLCTKALASH